MDSNNCSTETQHHLAGQPPTGCGLEFGQRSVNQSCGLRWASNNGLILSYHCSTISPVAASAPGFKPPLIDDETKRTLELVITVILLMTTSLFGILGNVVNILVYWKQGLSDSITLGFFALSVSDLILVTMPFLTGCMYTAKYALPNSEIHFSSIHYVSFGWVRNFMYSSSCLITAFLSLERCCCIVLPFRVQFIFTRTRTAIFLTGISVFHLGCMALLPVAMRLHWQKPSPNNPNGSKILRVWFSSHREDIEMFYSTSMSFIVPLACQLIVTVCAFIMVQGLRRASQFRTTAIGAKGREEQTKKGTQHEMKEIPLSKPYPTEGTRVKDTSRGSSSLSQKDARLIKTMIFLVSILSACNIPFLVATFAWKTIPDLNIGKPYQNLLSVIFSIVYLLGNINASSSIIVYYQTSTKFKAVARALFSMGTAKT